MSKIVDITEKLNFEQKPQIKIKDKVITINDDAVTMLKIMPLIESGSAQAAYDICRALFSEEDFAKIEALHLNFKDFTTLAQSAVKLVMGVNEQGEEVTRATT